jgi:hypothetical protein
VREALGLAPDAPIRLEPFPPPRGLLAGLIERVVAPDDDGDTEEPTVATLRAGLEAVHAATRALRAAGLLADGAPLGGAIAPRL